jgi:hypothetical protein
MWERAPEASTATHPVVSWNLVLVFLQHKYDLYSLITYGPHLVGVQSLFSKPLIINQEAFRSLRYVLCIF